MPRAPRAGSAGRLFVFPPSLLCPRMHTNLVGCAIDEIYVGTRVELVFEKLEGQDWYLPKFKPTTADS